MSTQINEVNTDAIRQCINKALQVGREYQSELTGYIHHHHKMDKNSRETIPVYENLLFAYALLRSRVVDNVQEAKSIISKILKFQTPNGHFPLYLHDYPEALYSNLAIRILPIYHGIIKNFYHVIGDELRTEIDKSCQLLLNYIEAETPEELPYHLQILRAAIYISLGDSRLKAIGEHTLEGIEKSSPQRSWMVPREMGDMIVGLQMIYPSLNDSPWKPFWEHLQQTWWKGQFIGPPLREHWYETASEGTLYHHFMDYFAKEESPPSRNHSISYLQNALIRPSQDAFLPLLNNLDEEGMLGDQSYTIKRTGNHALALLSCKGEQKREDGLHAMRLFWGEGLSLVIPRGKYDIDYQIEGEELKLYFTLPKTIDLDNHRHCREIAVYGSRQAPAQFRVEGSEANTFRMGEQITLKSGNQQLELKFELADGEGRFYGHYMRGNRPAQQKAGGEDHGFVAYDDMILLRTIERASSCQVKLSLKLTTT
ncbi:hypothetical protein SCG7109_AX_00090 [Chlamydiales bacterium SCGC AG-110-M15]|nr:hypothetical protein SCG7109_AX_00090 [Chlamydiales bacterium SCGC AG-110-M15]